MYIRNISLTSCILFLIITFQVARIGLFCTEPYGRAFTGKNYLNTSIDIIIIIIIQGVTLSYKVHLYTIAVLLREF